jgi:hypothetical protein
MVHTMLCLCDTLDGMWSYTREAIRIHPFNFFTLVIALTAAACAGWAAYEAHLTRVGADEASKAQAKDVERARIAAEESAHAVSSIARLNESKEGARLDDTWLTNDSSHEVLIITNHGSTRAQDVTGSCDRFAGLPEDSTQGEHLDHVELKLPDTIGKFTPSLLAPLPTVPAGQKTGYVVCKIAYKDVFGQPHFMKRCFISGIVPNGVISRCQFGNEDK